MSVRIQKLSEAAFQRQVIQLANHCGWAVASFRKVRVQRKSGAVYWETPVGANGKGWPDLVLMKERILYRELKTDMGRLEPEQEWWRDRITRAGGNWAIWRPEDWPLIEAVLKREME